MKIWCFIHTFSVTLFSNTWYCEFIWMICIIVNTIKPNTNALIYTTSTITIFLYKSAMFDACMPCKSPRFHMSFWIRSEHLNSKPSFMQSAKTTMWLVETSKFKIWNVWSPFYSTIIRLLPLFNNIRPSIGIPVNKNIFIFLSKAMLPSTSFNISCCRNSQLTNCPPPQNVYFETFEEIYIFWKTSISTQKCLILSFIVVTSWSWWSSFQTSHRDVCNSIFIIATLK